jgi:hypothetical protein
MENRKLLGREKKSFEYNFSIFFLVLPNLEDEILFRGVGFIITKVYIMRI